MGLYEKLMELWRAKEATDAQERGKKWEKRPSEAPAKMIAKRKRTREIQKASRRQNRPLSRGGGNRRMKC